MRVLRRVGVVERCRPRRDRVDDGLAAEAGSDASSFEEEDTEALPDDAAAEGPEAGLSLASAAATAASRSSLALAEE